MEEERQTQETGEIRIGKARIDKTVFELAVGIVCWGIICQAAFVWFVQDKSGYSAGLWTGVLLALAAAVHMWWGLNKALDFPQDSAVKAMTKYNITRYFLIVLVMAFLMISGFANPLSAFLALMGLKVSAYLQPFTHRICSKFLKKIY